MKPTPPWQERFTNRQVTAVQLGTAGRTSGLVAVAEGDHTGLAAWDVATGRDRSPLTHLAGLTAPVLIRQARYDSRTPARQMAAYERRARQRGRPVTVRWDEAGHAGVEDQLAFQQQMLEFASACRRAD